MRNGIIGALREAAIPTAIVFVMIVALVTHDTWLNWLVGSSAMASSTTTNMLPDFIDEDAWTTNANAPDNSGVSWRGGSGTFFGQGTWGSATAQLQYSIDGGSNWASVPGADVTLTADDIGGFTLGNCLIRVNVSGGSGQSLDLRVIPSGRDMADIDQ